MNTKYVACTLAAGFFDNELYVNLGNSSAIVDRTNLRITIEPKDLTEGTGSVCVFVVEEHSDKLLVEIPGEPVVGGLRTWVPTSMTAAAA